MLMEDLVGGTPLVMLPCLTATILAKLEWTNPAGSVKDRTALAMLRDAWARGLLKTDGTVIEATSGNTGIALAAAAAGLGYRCIIVMPENMSRERQLLMQAYGAKVILSPGEEGMAGAVRLAEKMARDIPGSYYADQFRNPANPGAHYAATGPEIWRQTGGNINIFVAGVGTGGTLSGVGRYLKDRDKDIRIIAVKPESGQQIPGLGAGFLPPVLDTAVIDEWFCVTQAQALAAVRQLLKCTGLLAGISSGAALCAAYTLAKQRTNHGKTVLTILPDSGERYLSENLRA